MSPSKTKPRAPGDRKRDSLPQPLPASVRAEFAFAMNEARALLDTAHVIEATLASLAARTTPRQVQTAMVSVRKLSPVLFEHLVDVCVGTERLSRLTAQRTSSNDDWRDIGAVQNDRSG